MNQEDIEKHLDKLLNESERELDKVFISRLKTMKDWLRDLYDRFPDGNGINRSQIYKYRRFEKELEMIKSNIHDDYKEAYALVYGLLASQWTENYLRSTYVYEMTLATDMQVAVPSAETIAEMVAHPIPELKLNKVLNYNRNQTLRKLRIELAQGIEAGESYSKMAKRLEDVFGFSRNKARTVARTEAGRVQTESRIRAIEKAEEYGAETKRFWMATLDRKTRQSHRNLDGEFAGKGNLFRYKGMTAIGPSKWVGLNATSMNINCRCDVGTTLDGEYPDSRRARDYGDAEYQQRLADRIDELMADEGITEKQATRKAKRHIYPPSKVMEYQTYDKWRESLLNRGGS